MLSIFSSTKSPDKSTSKSQDNLLITNPKTPTDDESTKKATPYSITNNNSVDEKATERKEDLFEKTFCESDLEKLKLVQEKTIVKDVVHDIQN